MASDSLRFTPFDRSIKQDPYPHYAYFRAKAPVINHFPINYVLDHQHAGEVLKNSTPFSSHTKPPGVGVDLREFKKAIRFILFQYDGEEHQELRTAGAQALKHIDPEEIISNESEKLYKELKKRKVFDFVQDYSVPLTSKVTCSILGLPESYLEQVTKWGKKMFKIAGLFVRREDFIELEKTSAEMNHQIEQILNHQTYADHGFIHHLVQYYQGTKDSNHSRSIIASWIVLFIFSAQETTSGALGNAIFNLLNQGFTLDTLRNKNAINNRAIEELLRFDTPLQFVSRTLTEDTLLNDVYLKKGELVAVCLGSANRDEKVFEKADQLILTRNSNPHLAFGKGEHYCFGARIARSELKHMLNGMLNHFQNINLDRSHTPEFTNVNVLKGFSSLMLKQ